MILGIDWRLFVFIAVMQLGVLPCLITWWQHRQMQKFCDHWTAIENEETETPK